MDNLTSLIDTSRKLRCRAGSLQTVDVPPSVDKLAGRSKDTLKCQNSSRGTCDHIIARINDKNVNKNKGYRFRLQRHLSETSIQTKKHNISNDAKQIPSVLQKHRSAPHHIKHNLQNSANIYNKHYLQQKYLNEAYVKTDTQNILNRNKKHILNVENRTTENRTSNNLPHIDLQGDILNDLLCRPKYKNVICDKPDKKSDYRVCLKPATGTRCDYNVRWTPPKKIELPDCQTKYNYQRGANFAKCRNLIAQRSCPPLRSKCRNLIAQSSCPPHRSAFNNVMKKYENCKNRINCNKCPKPLAENNSQPHRFPFQKFNYDRCREICTKHFGQQYVCAARKGPLKDLQDAGTIEGIGKLLVFLSGLCFLLAMLELVVFGGRHVFSQSSHAGRCCGWVIRAVEWIMCH